MQRASFFVSVLLIGLIIASGARAREAIRVVGSSTVFPFVSAAAERFGESTEFKTPIVESTGTGGGFEIFCEGVGEDTPDFANASRRIKVAELAMCEESDVGEVTEFKIGYDGIVVANAKDALSYDFKKAHLFLALAQKVPVNGKLVENPYRKWSDIDASLPSVEIAIYGPPLTSGTRDVFAELMMRPACEGFPLYRSIYEDETAYNEGCITLRNDGVYVESGENDNMTVQKLITAPEAIGLFGYSLLEKNEALIKANTINGVAPSHEHIYSGKYAIARSLYVYAKNAHAKEIPGFSEFAQELASDEAVGRNGYLTQIGLIPLPDQEHAIIKATVKAINAL